MSLWNSVRDIFQREEPSPGSVFRAASRHGIHINFNFVDCDKQSRNICCHIENLRKNAIYLELSHPLPSSMFSCDVCHLFFKLPPETLQTELGIKSDVTQNGFLCKSRIQDYDSDEEKLCKRLRISMPAQYTRRELRKFERHRILTGMISSAGLWILDGPGRPASPTPDFSFEAGEQYSSLHLVNISAGGAKVVLDNLDYLEKFANIESAQIVLRLSLAISSSETLNNWLLCRCLGSYYSIRFRRLTMRLQFLDAPGEEHSFQFLSTPAGDRKVECAAENNDSTRLLNWLAMWDAREN